MRLIVQASGSKGNSYILENENEALILDAGVSYKETLKTLNYNSKKIVGVCVTHSHLDHAKYVSEYAKHGIPVFKPYEVEQARCTSGNFKIFPFELKHNVPCYGFLIRHTDIGTLMYATDTCYIKYRFRNINHMIVECNWSKKYVDAESYKFEHELRDHMEQSTCMRFLESNKSSSLLNVVFAHLSESAIVGEEIIEEAKKTVSCPIWLADKGIEIELKNELEAPFM